MKEMIRKLKKVFEKVTGERKWESFPQVIQIDTNNHCGPDWCGVYCNYCYPQWKIVRGERKYAEMPTNAVELILRQIARHGKHEMDLVDFFLNGDGFTEPRLPNFHRYSKKLLPNAITQTFTNGVRWENYEAAMPLDRVCFTISAHTPSLYKKIHRGNHFEDALHGLELTLDARKQNQRVEVHCVITKDNYPHLRNWWRFFGVNYPDAVPVISPLVGSYDNAPSRLAAGELTLDQMEEAVIDVVGGEGRMWTRELIPDEKPCVLWDNMSVDVGGWILQCCNWSPPEDVNYGNVYKMEEEGYTLRDAWRNRLENRMDNRLCQSCNMKHSNHVKRMADMRVRA